MNPYKGIFDLVYPSISHLASKFLTDFNKDSLVEGISKGMINIENIKLSHENINQLFSLVIPIKITKAEISNFLVVLPNITNIMKESVVVEIGHVNVDFEMTDEVEWILMDNALYHKITLNILDNFKQSILNDLENKAKASDGILMGMVWKILDNLKVALKKLKFTMNMNKVNKKNTNVFILAVDQIDYYSTDKNFNYSVIDRSKCTDNIFHKILTVKNVLFSDLNEILLEPINFTFKINKNEKPNNIHPLKYEIATELPCINLNFNKEHLNSIVSFANHFAFFNRKLFEIKEKKKFLFFKPEFHRLMSRKQKAIALWKFSIKMVLKLNELYKGNNEVLSIPDKEKNIMKNEFVLLYQLFNENQLDDNLYDRLKFIINVIDEKTLTTWMQTLIEKEYLERKKKTQAQNKGLFSFSFFTGNSKPNDKDEEVILTNEEKKKIEDLINHPENKREENSFTDNFSVSFLLKELKVNFKQDVRNFFIIANNLMINTKVISNSKFYLECFLDNINLIFKNNENITYLTKTKSEKILFIKLSYLHTDKNIKPSLDISSTFKSLDILYTHDLFFFFSDYLSISSISSINDELADVILSEWDTIIQKSQKNIFNFYTYSVTVNIRIGPFKFLIPVSRENLIISLEEININSILDTSERNKSLLVDFVNINVYQENHSNKILEDFSSNTQIILYQNQSNLLNIEFNNVISKIKLNVSKNLLNLIEEIIRIYSNHFINKANEKYWMEIKPEQIIKQSTFSGNLLVRKKLINTWEEKIIYISRGSLFIFNKNDNSSNTLCKYKYFLLKNCVIEKKKKENCLELKNKYGDELILSFPNNQLETWFYQLNNATRFANYENINFYESINENEKKEEQIINFYMMAKIDTIKTGIFSDEGKILDLFTNDTIFNLHLINNEELAINFSIANFELLNHLTKFNLLEASERRDQEPLLIFKLAICNEKSKLFKGDLCNIFIALKEINLIYEPLIIFNLTKFIIEAINIFEIKNRVEHSNSLAFLNNDKPTNCVLENYIKYANVNFTLKKLNLILVHDKTQCMIFEFSCENINFGINCYCDHLDSQFDIGSVIISDMSNYPYTITNQNEFRIDNKKFLMRIQNKIKVKIFKFEKNCNLRKKDSLIIELSLDDFEWNFINQPIQRLVEYILKRVEEFKSLTTLQIEYKEYLTTELLCLDLKIKNPKIIIKAREKFSEAFIVDFGDIKITNAYNNEGQLMIILHCKDMLVSSFQGRNNSDFQIIPPTNLSCNATLPTECSFTDILLNIDPIHINLRQEDLHYLIKCIDLNFNYKDNKKEMKLFSSKNKKTAEVTHSSIINHIMSNNKKETIHLKIENPQVMLNIVDKHLIIFSSLTFKQLNFTYLYKNDLHSKTKEVKFTMKSVELCHLDQEMKIEEDILTYYHKNEGLINKNEIDFNIQLDLMTRKMKVNLNFNNILLLFKYDYFVLVSTFITESLPFYNEILFLQEDLPNKNKKIKNYLINQEREFNEFEIEITLIDPIIKINRFSSEDVGIKTKDIKIICKSKNYDKYFKELKDVREFLRANPEMLSDSLSPNNDFHSEIFVAFNNLEIFINNLNNVRYILKTDNKDSLLIMKFYLYLYLDSKLEVNDNISSIINLERIDMKLSYKDLLTFIKIIDLNVSSVKSKRFVDKISNMQMRKKQINEFQRNNFDFIENNVIISSSSFIDKFSLEFTGKKTEIIFINDHSNVYYPFMSFSLNDVTLFLYRNKEIYQQIKLDASLNFDLLSYNYIASKWEPIAEAIPVLLIYSKVLDNVKNDLPCEKDLITINIIEKNSKVVNINASDMSIAFLCTSLKSWIEKLLNEKNKYESNKFTSLEDDYTSMEVDEDNTNLISNHTVYNLSGRNLIIGRIEDEKFKHLLQINEKYDLEYISDENNILKFSLQDDQKNNDLMIDNQVQNKMVFQTSNIDHIEVKYHQVNFGHNISHLIPKPFDYLISEVNCENTKKHITIYSPLIFYNKTDVSLIMSLTNRNEEYLIILNPFQKSAVPNEYLQASCKIQNCLNEMTSDTLDLSRIINSPREYFKEIKIGNSFFNLHRNLNKSLNNVREIKITNSYIIKNCLPYDVMIFLPIVNQVFIIKRSDKVLIDSLPLSEDLVCAIQFSHYGTKRPVILCDIKNTNKDEKIRNIILEDKLQSNNQVTISYVLLKDKPFSHREIVLYSSHIFVNKSGLDYLRLFYDNKREIIPDKGFGNQNVFIYNNNVNEETKFYLDIYSAESSYVEVSNIQSNSYVTVPCKTKNIYYEFVVKSSLSNLPNLCIKSEIYSNIFTICPAFNIHNKMSINKICLCLKEDLYAYEIVDVDSSLPFYFFGSPKGKDAEICFKPSLFDEVMNEIGIRYEWSQPLSLTNVGIKTIPIFVKKSEDAMMVDINYVGNDYGIERIYINVEIKVENLVTDVYIYEADQTNSQFVIENNLSENLLQEIIDIKVYQEGYEKINYDFMRKERAIVFSPFNYCSNKEGFANPTFVFEIQRTDNKIIKLKYRIFEDQVENASNCAKYDYPYKDIINQNLQVKIISNGLKKTIKFEDNDNYGNKGIQQINNKLVNLLLLEIFVDKLGISVISDNKFQDKKLRNYQRREIAYILLNNIMISYSKKSKNNIKEIEDSEFNVSIADFYVDNQVSKFAKFPNVIRIANKDYSSKEVYPFFRLNVFSQIHKSDKISKIKYMNYDIRPIKLGVDAEFVEYIISFINNIFYQLNSKYIGVNNIFSSNEKFTQNEQIESRVSGYKYFANILEYSNLNLEISISEKGFKDFLYKHLDLGSFIVSLINNLTYLDDIKINLNGDKIKFYYGDIKEIIMRIFSQYKQQLLSKLFGLGARGLFLGIFKIFTKEQVVNMVPANARIRFPRALYGKYKCIKKYNAFHAEIMDKIKRNDIKIYDDFYLDFYNCEICTAGTVNIILLFTIKNIILINGRTLTPFHIIDYFTIDKVYAEDSQIVILYNQMIDGVIKII